MRRSLTVFLLARSSFFWLGLVGAVFIGLVLAITRARLARDPHIPLRLRAQQPKPQLWDVYVTNADERHSSLVSCNAAKFRRIQYGLKDRSHDCPPGLPH